MSALTGDDQWHISFKIPSLNAFSERTIDGIRTGIITKALRTEVVQTLTTLIANHTKRPSSDQYGHICSELVKAYPTLKDDAGNGYVSTCILLVIIFALQKYFNGEIIFK